MMNDSKCEEIMLAVMALGDNETPAVPASVVEEHLSACTSCSVWAGELADLSAILDGCRRKPAEYNLWPALVPSLTPSRARVAHRGAVAPFIILVAVLVGYRVLLYNATTPEVLLKLIVVALVVFAFVVARENPFRIETERALGAE
jgi:predicted anti-sigma-YlaC factor YlaD